jgi:hypothetical protein
MARCEICGEVTKSDTDLCYLCTKAFQAECQSTDPFSIQKESKSEGTSSKQPEESNLFCCPDCGKEISKRAASCPHCGCPINMVGFPTSRLTSEQKENKSSIGCGVFLLFFVFIAVSSVLTSKSHKSPPLTSSTTSEATYSLIDVNRLNELQSTMTYNGKQFIKSYNIDGGSVYLKLSANLWNSLSTYQQRQICDSLAATDVWKKTGVINAWLSVGSTEIGRIKPTLSGGFEFSPTLSYLK